MRNLVTSFPFHLLLYIAQTSLHACCTALHCVTCFMCKRVWPGICLKMFHFHCQNNLSGLHVQLSGLTTSNVTHTPFAVTGTVLFIEENFLFRNWKPFKFVLALITLSQNNVSFAVAELINFPGRCFHASCPDMFSCTFMDQLSSCPNIFYGSPLIDLIDSTMFPL